MKTTVVMLLGCLALAGCSGMSDTQQRAVTGTGIGAAGGAILGAIGGNAALGAVAGAAAGLAGGLIYDNVKKNEQASYNQGYAAGKEIVHGQPLGAHAMFDIFDIYLLEALINGVLLGGVLALLALGLNLIFGVIDVVWICYAELIMLGMYGMFFLFKIYGVPFLIAAVICIAGVGVLGVVLHLLVIAPLLGAAPINQLLATGGVLFFLQSAATVMFGIDFRNLGIRLPVLAISEMFISYARLLAFGAALAGMVMLYLFLSRTYTGTAIRAIAQDRQIMPLMGVDARRIYIITSAIGGALAGLAACLLVLQYDVHPFLGLTFGPTTFMICVLGGLGNMIGGFVAAFVFAEIISVSGLYLDLEWGYVFAFAFFIAMMFAKPQGLLARRA